MVMVSNIRVFFIFIVTKTECWPVFKQDPKKKHVFPKEKTPFLKCP